MHDQLQDILNKCIEKGWRPFGIVKEYKFSFKYNGNNDYILMKELIDKDKFFCRECEFSTNDLFSKDSGLMEFVKWQYKPMEYIYIKDMDMDYHYICNKAEYTYHSMIMGPMTAKEKVKYFIDNVII